MEIKIKLGELTVDNKKMQGISLNFDEKYAKFVELKQSQITLIKLVGIANVSAEVVEKLSEKTGEIYKCIELSIGEDYKTIVFLDNAEKAIVDFLS